MTITEMRQWLSAENIQLTKSLGQNFLIDGNQVRRILAAADLAPTDSILEIGPGLGAMTEVLLQRVARVRAVEIDRRLCQVLERRFEREPRLLLVHADALDYLKENRLWDEWKMVANLPYSAASAILVEFARMPHGPARIAGTLQMEVAQRLMAKAGDPDYGILTLLVQFGYEPGAWFKIPPTCFFPQPDIDSACISLTRRSELRLNESQSELFVRIVKLGFSQRRKMMFKLLRSDWPESVLSAAFDHLHLAHNVRAEIVHFEQFIELSRFLSLHPRAAKPGS
jgi:16S rRNA (adenine1518-N6/adenine1519-N6)-dimethyltransferase